MVCLAEEGGEAEGVGWRGVVEDGRGGGLRRCRGGHGGRVGVLPWRLLGEVVSQCPGRGLGIFIPVIRDSSVSVVVVMVTRAQWAVVEMGEVGRRRPDLELPSLGGDVWRARKILSACHLYSYQPTLHQLLPCTIHARLGTVSAVGMFGVF